MTRIPTRPDASLWGPPRTMSGVSPEPQRPQQPGRGRPPTMPTGPSSWSRPIVCALIGMVLIAFLLSSLLGGGKSNQIQYIPDFLDQVNNGQVKSIDVYADHTTKITADTTDGKSFTTTGPNPLPDKDLELFRQKNVKVSFHSP